MDSKLWYGLEPIFYAFGDKPERKRAAFEEVRKDGEDPSRLGPVEPLEERSWGLETGRGWMR